MSFLRQRSIANLRGSKIKMHCLARKLKFNRNNTKSRKDIIFSNSKEPSLYNNRNIFKQMNKYQQTPQKSQLIKKTHKTKLRKLRESSWTIEQQIKYVQFLKKNNNLMKSSKSRKVNKVFKKISQSIRTRTSVQAKSHHQKMERKYQSISNIIYEVSLYIKRALNEEYHRMRKTNQKIEIGPFRDERTPPECVINDTEPLNMYDLGDAGKDSIFGEYFDNFNQHYLPIEESVLILEDDQWF